MRLSDKIVLVTGAGQGIGRGSALRLAEEGADVALADVKADQLESVRKEDEALERKSTTVVADVSSREEVYAAIDYAEKELGGFDVMVNDAGIAQVKPIADVTPRGHGPDLPHQCRRRAVGHPGGREEIQGSRTERQDRQCVFDRRT